MHPHLARSYADIDLVCGRKAGRETSRFLVASGYEANERFNAMNGSERMIFHDPPNGRHIDLFVGGFRMCHALPLADRFEHDSPTLPLAELLLTKLQVVQMNAKDANDIIALLLDHDVGESDDDTVNSAYVAELLARDWGLWRTSLRIARPRAGGTGPKCSDAQQSKDASLNASSACGSEWSVSRRDCAGARALASATRSAGTTSPTRSTIRSAVVAAHGTE